MKRLLIIVSIVIGSFGNAKSVSLDREYSCYTTNLVEVSTLDTSTYPSKPNHDMATFINENFGFRKDGSEIVFIWKERSLWPTNWKVTGGIDKYDYFSAHASKHTDFLYYDEGHLLLSHFTMTRGIRVASAKCRPKR